MDQNLDHLYFERSNYLMQEIESVEDSATSSAAYPLQPQQSLQKFHGVNSVTSNEDIPRSRNIGGNELNIEDGCRVVFRTRSSIDVMDDGFKWRKYGKKMVKSSPNPRNYFRCTSKWCKVKKRVERDREDSSFVITTYHGKHNHESPCVLYYSETHHASQGSYPNGLTLKPVHFSFSRVDVDEAIRHC